MICVSIARGRHRHMIAEHRHLVQQGAQLVELRGDYYSNPVLLLSSSNSLTVYCVYDHHDRLRMLKINPASNSVAFSANSALNKIVIKSPCQIEQGGKADWESVLRFFKNPTNNQVHCEWLPTMDFGIVRIFEDSNSFIQLAQGQFNAYFLYGAQDPWAD